MKHQLGIAQSVHTAIYFQLCQSVPRLEDIVNMVIVSQEDKILPYDILVVVHVNHYSYYVSNPKQPSCKKSVRPSERLW